MLPCSSICVRILPIYFVSVVLPCVFLVSVLAQDYDMDDNAKDVKEEAHSLSEWLAEDQKRAIPWSDLCPPPVQPLSAKACNASPCSANSECAPRHNNTYLCCSNGCVDTCMRALEPPPVFDWIDEPPDKKPFIVAGQVASHSSPPESVALPGGCVISPTQFLSLEGFKQNQHVSECFCHVGRVFCKILQ